MEIEGEAAVEQVFGAPQVFQARERVAPGHHDATIVAQAQSISQAPPAKLSRSLSAYALRNRLSVAWA